MHRRQMKAWSGGVPEWQRLALVVVAFVAISLLCTYLIWIMS